MDICNALVNSKLSKKKCVLLLRPSLPPTIPSPLLLSTPELYSRVNTVGLNCSLSLPPCLLHSAAHPLHSLRSHAGIVSQAAAPKRVALIFIEVNCGKLKVD